MVNQRATGVAVGGGGGVGDGVGVGTGVAATIGETGVGVGAAHAVHRSATTPMSAAARITQRYTVLSL